MKKLLEVRHLRASYGGRRILEDVSLHVSEGEIVTVIGHNGAGKSTLLKSIFRLVPWSEGEVLLEDRPIHALPPNRILAAGVAFVPQHRSVFPKLTIGENLWMGGYLVDDKALLSRRLRDVEELFPLLAERRGQLAGTLSGGEQRMLEVARTLLTDPRVIMLDEPSIGLAPKMVDAVFDTVRLLRSRGKAVLMVEQNVKKALAASDRGYVMTLGEIKLEDQARRLIGDPRVEQLYMGQKGVRAIFP
ncbi:MAG TPA: ABC transporter ATP-binding protein [Burkholderiales bacterium]|nr:ABC transporter ATP-binding protein [Burkholderiales bacterium]